MIEVKFVVWWLLLCWKGLRKFEPYLFITYGCDILCISSWFSGKLCISSLERGFFSCDILASCKVFFERATRPISSLSTSRLCNLEAGSVWCWSLDLGALTTFWFAFSSILSNFEIACSLSRGFDRFDDLTADAFYYFYNISICGSLSSFFLGLDLCVFFWPLLLFLFI